MQPSIQIADTAPKADAIAATQQYIQALGFHTGETDLQKPWGAYFYIDPADTAAFIDTFFPELPPGQLQRHGIQLQPKFLLAEPGKRLSWQYHHRRAELWKVVAGPVGVTTSNDDTESEALETPVGRLIQFDAEVRHRLSGLHGWGLIAEIWQHTDPERPSDEADIVRVADDYQRE